MIVLRGVPGSGKSTLVRKEFNGAKTVSADDFFVVEGEYRFDPTKLPLAHQACFRGFVEACLFGTPLIVVDNTSTTAMEASPYVLCGETYGYKVEVVTLHCDPKVAASRNLHGVPEAAVLRMDERLRGEFIPPWWNHRVVEL